MPRCTACQAQTMITMGGRCLACAPAAPPVRTRPCWRCGRETAERSCDPCYEGLQGAPRPRSAGAEPSPSQVQAA